MYNSINDIVKFMSCFSKANRQPKRVGGLKEGSVRNTPVINFISLPPAKNKFGDI